MAEPTVIIDLLEGSVRWKEVKGVVTEISRMALVHGNLSGHDIGAVPIAESVIARALNHSDMPQAGVEHDIYSGLFLVERNPIVRDKTIIQIELRYKRHGGADQPPPGEPWTIRGGASLEEIETQLDRNGDQITLEHNGVTQGGTIHPLMPRRELEFEWTGQADIPGDLVDAFVGKVNESTWEGGAPGTWLCIHLVFDLVDPTSVPITWKFNAKFRHKDDGTGAGNDPQVVFKDPETGEPPAGLVAGVGYKVIPWYLVANFGALP